jgi:hypothetical protein
MSKEQPSEKNKDNVGTPGLARNLSGNRSEQATLRREQREQLESNQRQNRATGKEDEADHRCHKHNPRKRRNGGMLFRKNSFKDGAMYHVDPLLGNDRK